MSSLEIFPAKLANLSFTRAITLLFTVNFVVMTSQYSVLHAARYVLQNTNVSLSNIVACHVFRGLALGTLEDATNNLNSIRIASTLRPQVPPVAATQDFTMQVLGVHAS